MVQEIETKSKSDLLQLQSELTMKTKQRNKIEKQFTRCLQEQNELNTKIKNEEQTKEMRHEITQLLNIKQAYCLGLSMGGHVGMDLLDKWSGLQGLIAIGTPPIESTKEGIQQGFLPNEEILKLLAKDRFDDAEAKLFTLANGIPEEAVGQFIETTKLTDGRTRRVNREALLDGRRKNQKQIIEETQKPVQLLLGEHDKGISRSYIQTHFPKLLTVIPGVGHAANWAGYRQCNEIIMKFCQSSSYVDAVRAAGGSPIYPTGNAPDEVTKTESHLLSQQL